MGCTAAVASAAALASAGTSAASADPSAASADTSAAAGTSFQGAVARRQDEQKGTTWLLRH